MSIDDLGFRMSIYGNMHASIPSASLGNVYKESYVKCGGSSYIHASSFVK